MIDNWFTRRFPFMALAYRNLTRAKARSVLAMAGITIGVVAIASLGMFGAAFQQSQIDQAEDYLHTVSVFPGEDAEYHNFSRDQVGQIERNAGEGEVHPVIQTNAEVTGFRTSTVATVYAVDDPHTFVTVREGEIPDAWRSGAVIGADLADELDVGAGDSVEIDGRTRHVVAVLEQSPRGSFLRPDDAVMLPPEQLEEDRYSYVLVRYDDPNQAFRAADGLRESLNGREEKFAINDAEAALENFNQMLAQIQTFLLGIGGVSLLVASVSILNVMLMSTIERKEEIGVMRAVGYRRLDVLRLMLNEAALLGIVGAVFGVILSILMGMLINVEFLDDPLAFTAQALTYAGLGFVFGTLASFISGLYPAWKAANARPVEALRD